MTSADGVLGRLGVRPAERALFGWGGLCLVLLGAAAFALLNTAETLFLKRVGVESLPLALLASSALLVVTTAGVGRIAGADPARWLPRVLAALALAPLPFVLLADSQAPLVFGALVLVSRQVLALGLLAFWVAMGDLVPARRAKQLFAPLASGVTLGGVVGSFASEPTARWLGVDGLIALCALALAGAALVARRVRRSGTRRLERAVGGRPTAGSAPGAGIGELLRTSRLFRLLAVALVCGGGLYPVLYFEFTTVLDAATQGPGGEQQLLGLYSQFRGWVNVAMLFSQLSLSASLYRRVGLPLAMALWPLAYLLGFSWIAVDFALLAAIAGFGAARVAEEGVGEPAARVLTNLFPDALRASATSLLVGPVNRLGGVLGNGLVLGAIALGGAAWVGLAAMPVAALWLVSSLVLWRAYPRLLLRASAEHGLVGAGIDRAALLDAATLRSLAASLADPDPRACRAAVDLVATGEPAVVIPLLADAIESAPPANRPQLVEALQRAVETGGSEARGGEAAESLARSLRARPPLPAEERADLLRVYARLTAGEEQGGTGSGPSRALLERALGDRAAPVRLAAAAELHRRGAPPPGLPDLDRTLADALTASDALIRRAARKELRAMLRASTPDAHSEQRLRVLAEHLGQRSDRAETAEALRDVARRHPGWAQPLARDALRYADDRDPRVRGALLAIAGHAGLAEAGPRLVASLGARAPEEAQGAHEGLVALGPTAALPLLVGLEFGGPAQRDALLAVLRELEVDAETLGALRARQLEAVEETVVFRAAVDDLEGGLATLLRRRLEERITEGLGALLDLLAALRDDPRLAELEHRLRRASGGHERDLLIEGVDSLLDRGERDVIVPLLEPGGWADKGAAAAAARGRRLPRPAAALDELRRGPDPTARGLALAISLEGGEAMGEAGPVPAAMDIAVRLQDVPAFDRLSTQQLMAIAELLQEQKLAEGERIYGAGEEALGLYFVLEGEVALRRGALELERAGAGSFFGERSALDGLPRAADAVATAPTRLLRLDRDDLLRLLEQAPALAIGLAQRLSSRLRRLEDRLEAASEPTGDAS
ncbi:MAG: cyclic nucleotide-binding domain-containing protein [Myxococcota bacterium]|nr:cyclic nucleotide-binding domain-containing protein [Myxococcota bacterium]